MSGNDLDTSGARVVDVRSLTSHFTNKGNVLGAGTDASVGGTGSDSIGIAAGAIGTTELENGSVTGGASGKIALSTVSDSNLSLTGVTAGTYPKVTVTTRGRITGASSTLSPTDLAIGTATTSGNTPSTTAADKIVSASTTVSGNAITTSNKVVDESSVAPAYVTPHEVGEWIGLRRVVQSPLESGASNPGVSVMHPFFATASVGSNVVAGTATPSGRVTASWVYVPATINVQHVRFAYVTALPVDIQDVRVGIWNASTLTNLATSSSLVNSSNAGVGTNTPATDNSRFQTASGVSVQAAQSAAGTSLDVVCTNGRPVVGMQQVNVTATNTGTVTGLTTFQLSSVANLYVGQTMSGTGVAGGTVIQSINTATREITVNNSTTLSGTVTLTFNTNGLLSGTTVTNVVPKTGVTNGYTLTLSASTTFAIAAGIPLNLSPNRIIDTRRQVYSFGNMTQYALPTPNPAFASPVTLAAGWWLVGVWNGGAAVGAVPTLASSPQQSFTNGIFMGDPNGPTGSSQNIFKVGLAYSDSTTLSSSSLPTFSNTAALTAATLYLDLTA